MNRKVDDSGDGLGWLILIIILIAIAVGSIDQSRSPDNTSSIYTPPEPTEYWKYYSNILYNQEAITQLANTQRLVRALRDDIERLELQNVNIQSALVVVDNQIREAQRQSIIDKQKQQKEQLLTTILGAFHGAAIGWVISVIAPPIETWDKVRNSLRRLTHRNHTQ